MANTRFKWNRRRLLIAAAQWGCLVAAVLTLRDAIKVYDVAPRQRDPYHYVSIESHGTVRYMSQGQWHRLVADEVIFVVATLSCGAAAFGLWRCSVSDSP